MDRVSDVLDIVWVLCLAADHGCTAGQNERMSGMDGKGGETRINDGEGILTDGAGR